MCWPNGGRRAAHMMSVEQHLQRLKQTFFRCTLWRTRAAQQGTTVTYFQTAPLMGQIMYSTKAKRRPLISWGVTLMYNLTFLISLHLFFFSPPLSLTVHMGAAVSESQPSFKARSSLASWDRLLFHIALVTMSHSPPGVPASMLPLCLFNHAKSCSTLGCFDISVINPFPLSIRGPPYHHYHVILLSVMAHSAWHLLRDPGDFFFFFLNPHSQIGNYLIPVEQSHETRKGFTRETAAVKVATTHKMHIKYYLNMQDEHQHIRHISWNIQDYL